MKTTVGMALALSLALLGCEGESPQAGGGGGAGTNQETQAQRAGTNPQLAKESLDNLREAARNASEARTNVARKDWDAAKSQLDMAQDRLTDVAQEIHPSMQADVTEMRNLADQATAGIKNRSAYARQDLDRLVTRINRLATEKVQAGGGKPAGTQPHR